MAILSVEMACLRKRTSFNQNAHLLNLAELVMKPLYDDPKMFHMFFFILVVDQDVINENHDKLA
jgi:hypothetical protein